VTSRACIQVDSREMKDFSYRYDIDLCVVSRQQQEVNLVNRVHCKDSNW